MSNNRKSKAISANGTTLEFSTGATGSIAVSGITQATGGGVFTVATGHGLVKGDVVDVASVGGMTELNGFSFPVIASAASSVTLDINTSQYATYSTGGTLAKKTWVETVEHKTIQRNKNPRAEIPHTTLVSESHERQYGLEDGGNMTVQINRVETETAQARFATAERAGSAHWVRIKKRNNWYKIMQVQVKNFGENEAVDAIADGSLEFGITGKITSVSST